MTNLNVDWHVANRWAKVDSDCCIEDAMRPVKRYRQVAQAISFVDNREYASLF
jgi:hypothetical protein